MSQSVRRAARIVDSIALRPASVSELAEEFGVHRSTMFREVQSLEEVGYLRKRKNGEYVLGLHLIALAHQASDSLDLREIAHDRLVKLHRTVGNTLHLAALVDHSIVYVDKVEDTSGVRMYSRIGSPARPYCSGVGKAILAELSASDRDAVLRDTIWEPFTAKTLTTRPELDAELERVAARGWAVDDGEFEDFVNCIAVPIYGPTGVIGALSNTAIRMAADLNALRAHLPLLQSVAREISAELGGV
ncbi:IclR family transcriptional regulator [Salinibacterium sp. UTAS2018]|uniref:IclR family transcriptional regulator n=1 Tax=Salinibacterium sp. UTAS2018 TaxID=2508880 RepID=UPI0010095ED0|nr:IclR family transcriptional regulator [Salinibacterium sp. UTAS2018]QAV70588.1 IclR family transcriptional regulator [Salinibacterium sp. UTAS2018]